MDSNDNTEIIKKKLTLKRPDVFVKSSFLCNLGHTDTRGQFTYTAPSHIFSGVSVIIETVNGQPVFH